MDLTQEGAEILPDLIKSTPDTTLIKNTCKNVKLIIGGDFNDNIKESPQKDLYLLTNTSNFDNH